MPEESCWHSFFNPQVVLRKMRLDSTCNDVAEIGCGYGTFTIPAAHIVSGIIYAFDIEPEMVEATRQSPSLRDARTCRSLFRDVVTETRNS